MYYYYLFYKINPTIKNTKVRIGCAGIHTPDHRMNRNLVGVSYIYIKESVYAFIDSLLCGKAAFVWQTLAHVQKSRLVPYIAIAYPFDFNFGM